MSEFNDAALDGPVYDWSPRVVEVRKRAALEMVFDEVLPAFVPVAEDPDAALARLDRSGAVSLGRPVDVAEYQQGTWFYYGAEVIGVRLPGQEGLARVEGRI